MLVTGVATLAYAQAPISGLAAQADSRVQTEAEVVSRILAIRPAYTGTGERVGRVVTVTVASDRASIIAIAAFAPDLDVVRSPCRPPTCAKCGGG